MTQVRLWQIVGQTPNTIIFSDADGNLTTLPAGTQDQVLVINSNGAPEWVANAALSTALEAKADVSNALSVAKAYTEAQIAALVDNAPIALNTLNELAVKLNGEDSAINALLLQVDGKAEKTEVVTLIAQTKQDTMSDCKGYTDNAVGTLMAGITSQLNVAKGDILAQAAADATFRADNATASAVQIAASYTNQKFDEAVNLAKQDAFDIAGGIKSEAVREAGVYTDQAFATAQSAFSEDAQRKADVAEANAISAAADDATAKVAGLRDAIPGRFWVEGTSTACFLASSTNLDRNQATDAGFIVTEHFTEVTGAAVTDHDPFLNAKLLFVNGVAVGDDWMSTRVGNNQLVIRFSQRLAEHVFDGSENALMLLAEYKSYNAISVRA